MAPVVLTAPRVSLVAERLPALGQLRVHVEVADASTGTTALPSLDYVGMAANTIAVQRRGHAPFALFRVARDGAMRQDLEWTLHTRNATIKRGSMTSTAASSTVERYVIHVPTEVAIDGAHGSAAATSFNYTTTLGRPFAARDIPPALPSLHCGACDARLTLSESHSDAPFKRAVDLPSAHWHEFIECWVCHPDDEHLEKYGGVAQQCAVEQEGRVSASARSNGHGLEGEHEHKHGHKHEHEHKHPQHSAPPAFAVKRGVWMLGGGRVVLHRDDLAGSVNITPSSSVHCTQCATELGTAASAASSNADYALRLHAFAVTVGRCDHADSNKTAHDHGYRLRTTYRACLLDQLRASNQAHAYSKFILVDAATGAPLALIWVFAWDTEFCVRREETGRNASSTTSVEHVSLPVLRRGLKLWYALADDEGFDDVHTRWTNMANDSSNSATVELHAVDGPRFHASMAKALRASTEVLPQFYREMMAGMARSGAFTALRPAFLAYGED